MGKSRFIFLGVFSLLSTWVCQAATLPTGMSQANVGTATRTFATGSALRLMRSAEALPAWPGFRVGLELNVLPMRNLNQLGNGDGSLPVLLPMPRLTLNKGLGADMEVTFATFPFFGLNTVGVFAGGLKWTVNREDDQWFATAVYFNFTHMRALSSSILSNTAELGVMLSKDYVRLRPYLGLGVSISSGEVAAPYATPGANQATETAIKIFAGLDMELPMCLGVQVDLVDWVPNGSLFVGFRL